VRIEEFLESRSASEKTFLLTEEEVSHLVAYIRKFSFIEVLDFSAQIANLHDITKDAMHNPEKGVETVTGLLAFIRMIESIKDSRELFREILNAPDFTPPTPSDK